MTRRRLARRLFTVAAATTIAFSLTACDQLGIFGGGASTPQATVTVTANANGSTPTPTTVCDNYVFDSVFSAYGSVHYSLRLAPALTLTLDMFTEQKTHDWYPETAKNLSFTMHVVDSRVPLRAKFTTKRKVYMSEIQIVAQTQKADGSDGSIAYSLDTDPRKVTLDPEALQDKLRGLLITSPKGGFELDGVKLKTMAAGTVGFDMNFTFTVFYESRAGSDKYTNRIFTASIPVAVFTAATADQSTSCATNSTLKPQVAGQ